MRLSVIVPLGPHETEWPGLLRQLEAVLGDDCDIVVVAAGEPVDLPLRATVRFLGCEPGRARQMNLGASQARGEVLWFLHADTRLSDAAYPALRRFMALGATALGWFDLAFRDDGPWPMRWNALGANFRSRRLGIPFGDQGFVVPAALFREVGGFDTGASYGEDHLFVWAVRRAGYRVSPVGAELSTSARKYAERGWGRTTFRHLWLTGVQAWPQFWRTYRR